MRVYDAWESQGFTVRVPSEGSDMTTLREAAEMALEVLEESCFPRMSIKHYKLYDDAIDALEAALAQPDPEPVAWMVYTLDGKSAFVTDNPADFTQDHQALPLYTQPPQREWIGLTDAELEEFSNMQLGSYDLCDAIEERLEEKNRG